MKVYSGNSVRNIENACFASGISESRLMENAGSACAKVLRDEFELDMHSEKKTVILCGKGKNGGDGFVIARKLTEIGMKPTVVLTAGYPSIAEPVEMFERARDLGVRFFQLKTDSYRSLNEIKTADILIDCVFGIGYHGSPDEYSSLVFDAVNSSHAKVVSVDVPSGLDSEGHDFAENHIRADLTIAISVMKPVNVKRETRKSCGKIKVVNIGIDERFFKTEHPVFQITDEKEVGEMFPLRSASANKGDFGHLLCVCGSYNMPGAAVMCTKSAVGSGAGKVTLAFPDKAYCAVTAHMFENMFLPLASDENGMFSSGAQVPLIRALSGKTAVLIGCGLGRSSAVKELVYSVVRACTAPLIIDADGINAVAANIDILKERKGITVLTPHLGEFAGLTGLSVTEIEKNKYKYAADFAEQYGVILVLKGRGTLIACKDEPLYVNPTGNAGLAQGGTGDVLAGLLAGFTAQGFDPVEAAVAAVYIHGEAGDICAEKYSQMGMTPNHLINSFPDALKKYQRE